MVMLKCFVLNPLCAQAEARNHRTGQSSHNLDKGWLRRQLGPNIGPYANLQGFRRSAISSRQ